MITYIFYSFQHVFGMVQSARWPLIVDVSYIDFCLCSLSLEMNSGLSDISLVGKTWVKTVTHSLIHSLTHSCSFYKSIFVFKSHCFSLRAIVSMNWHLLAIYNCGVMTVFLNKKIFLQAKNFSSNLASALLDFSFNWILFVWFP